MREELISVPTNDIVFVDVNAQLPEETATCDVADDESSEENDSKDEILSQIHKCAVTSSASDANTASNNNLLISNEDSPKIDDNFNGRVILVKRRKKEQTNKFSDSDCSGYEIRIRYDG